MQPTKTNPVGLGPRAAGLSYSARQLLLGQYIDKARSGALYSDPQWAQWGAEMRQRGMIHHPAFGTPAKRPGPTIDDLIFRYAPGTNPSSYSPPVNDLVHHVPPGGMPDPMTARGQYAAYHRHGAPGTPKPGSGVPMMQLKPLLMPPPAGLSPAAIEKAKNTVQTSGGRREPTPREQAIIDTFKKNATAPVNPNAIADGHPGSFMDKLGNTVDDWVTFGLAGATGKAWGDVDSGHGSKGKAAALTAGLVTAIILAAATRGEDAAAADVAERGVVAAARPGGLLLKKVGGYWIKTVNPNASRIMQWYAKKTLDQQAQALAKLGNMAPKFIYKGGKLIVKDVGKFKGGIGLYLKILAQGSKRLGPIFNDIKPRNMGANGQIFDPVLPPGEDTLLKTLGGSVAAWIAYEEYQRRHGR